jgi:proteasome lid subunit RPN8/RPN11
LKLTTEIKQQIIAHAQHLPNLETCGLICGDRIFPCGNIANNPKEAFEISTDYFEEINAATPVTAIYHSHWQDSQPALLSPTDISNSKASKIPYLLYHTAFGQWDYYSPGDIYPYPLIPNLHSPKSLEYYLGWKFEYNRSDCYTLFRSYYKGMLGVELPDFPRGDIEETTSPDWDMFTDSFVSCGFRKLVSGEPLQINDVILMCITGSCTHHAAILLDPSTGKALHNLGEGRLSEIFMYGGYWVERTRLVIRYSN